MITYAIYSFKHNKIFCIQRNKKKDIQTFDINRKNNNF